MYGEICIRITFEHGFLQVLVQGVCTLGKMQVLSRKTLRNLDVLKGTVSRDFFAPGFFINLFILVSLEMSMGRFICSCFSKSYCTFKTTHQTDTSHQTSVLGIQRAGESLFFYLDLDIGLPWVNFKAINLKLLQMVGHIVL